MPAQANPRSLKQLRRRARWPHVYVLLVAMDLATACLGLMLNQRLTDLYHRSVQRDARWSERAERLADATAAVTRIDARATAQALGGESPIGSEERYREAPDVDLSRLAAELDALGSADVASRLRAALDEVRAITAGSATVPAHGVASTSLLAEMNDRHARAMSALIQAGRDIRRLRLEAFAADARQASTLRTYFLSIVAMIVVLVVAVTIYGMTLVRRFSAAERDVERYLAALEASEARNSAVLENALDAIVIMDGDGIITEFNPAAERTFGFTRADAVGRKLSETIIPEELREAHQRGLARYLSTGEGPVLGERIEIRGMRADGREFPVELAIVAVNRGGSPFFIGHLRDITERKAAEEELRASNRELEQFAFIASHDLQEPLRMVTSYLGLLRKRFAGAVDAKADSYIEVAMDGAARMHHLIQDLLAFSRVERSGEPIEPVSSEGALAEALANLEAAVADSKARIAHGPLPRVRIERTQLVQLIQNLVGNAIKFRGHEPPSISISAQRTGAWWRFDVADNGIGIEPGQSERIFEVFQRLHGREQYPGTGIGLAICKKVVERNGGRIWVESTPGRGATFSFTLPA